MSGQPTPPRIVEAFAISAASQFITNPFPVPSQVGIVDGAASLHDGFPPLTFLALNSGGVPPSGADFNGILYLISAWVAFLAAGQTNGYDATLQTGMSGYADGAVLTQAGDPTARWISNTSGNTTDPDTGGTGWISSKPLYSFAALTGVNNVVLPGASDYLIDVSASGGAIAYTGFVAQRDGQQITFRKSDNSGNAITFVNSSGSSSAANEMQLPGTASLVLQYMTITIRYNSTLGKWFQV